MSFGSRGGGGNSSIVMSGVSTISVGSIERKNILGIHLPSSSACESAGIQWDARAYFLIAYCGASLLCLQNLDIFNVWEIRQIEARQSVRDNRSYRSKSCPFRVPRCEPCLL